MATKCNPIHRIEYHDTGSDDYGRRRFTVFWMADYHPGHPDGEYRTAERGQGFFADPARFEAELRGGMDHEN